MTVAERKIVELLTAILAELQRANKYTRKELKNTPQKAERTPAESESARSI